MGKEQVYSAKVKHKGNWKFSDIYSMVFDWLKKNGYSVSEGLYKESVGEGKDIEIEWEASKKVTDYFKYTITVDWSVVGMKDVEVEVDGKIQKMNKGDISIKVKAIFTSDYAGVWDGKPMYKLFRGIYEKYIIDSNVKAYSGKLGEEATELVEDVKSFLRMGG